MTGHDERPLANAPSVERYYPSDRNTTFAVAAGARFEPEVEAMCELLVAVSRRLMTKRPTRRPGLTVVK